MSYLNVTVIMREHAFRISPVKDVAIVREHTNSGEGYKMADS